MWAPLAAPPRNASNAVRKAVEIRENHTTPDEALMEHYSNTLRTIGVHTRSESDQASTSQVI